MSYQFSGTHITAEFYGIALATFLRQDIESYVKECCILANVTCLGTQIHFFDNGGYTLLCLLAESHIAIHTYIEHQAVFLDVFTCGTSKPEKILTMLQTYYQPKKIHTQTFERGNEGKHVKYL